ncbi:MAG: regulatory iron-sulfur-containing complex subunit RicT [Candidatus Nanoarchaeia archaeon]
MDLICEIIIETGARYLAGANKSLNLKPKDWCIVRKDRILDYGRVMSIVENQSKEPLPGDFPVVERKATVIDQSKAHENLMRAKSAQRTAAQYIAALKLPMKLLNCHYSFDMKLVTFQFTAPGRVDFRELVKQLSQSLNTRIDLRQIGVRDETALLGGFGVCGLQVCCNKFLKKFDSINVKMAKEQDLSLNPNNISGICGRLKCCLKYEHEGYLELDKGMPRRGALCDCSQGRGRVVDRNLLTQKVTIQLEETGQKIICPKEDVIVVYPEKYKLESGAAGSGQAQESEDLFAGLSPDEAKLLKEISDDN